MPQGILSLLQLVLKLLNLLLQASDLLMPLPQLLKRIHQRVDIHRRQRADSITTARRQAVAVGLEVFAVQAPQDRKPVLAVRLLPSLGQTLAIKLVVSAQFQAYPTQARRVQKRL